ncbi:MAG: dual specificity protein phosphatase [Chloroflexota bacterium]
MDYSKITEELLIGTTPTVEDYDLLREMGVGLVINMRLERRPYPDLHVPPLKFLWLPTIDWPLFPIPIFKLKRGARLALETIRTGRKVFTHCAGGRHRGVAMGAAVLIAQGFNAEEAMQLISARREVADPQVYYIRSRILRFAQQWQTA